MKEMLKIFTALVLVLSLGFLAACQEDDETLVPRNELVANAGQDQTAEVHALMLLDGSKSSDGNGKPFDYLWSIKSMPDSSNAEIATPDSVKSFFSPDVEGSYVIELTIFQGSWMAKDEVIFTALPRNPDPGTGEPGPTATVLNENITTNTTLVDIFEDDKPDYIVKADISISAELTINPGVIIAFEEDKGLTIYSQGSLIAQGTSDKQIQFIGKDPAKGYWKGLLFSSNNEKNELSHVIVDGGGSSYSSEIPDVKGNVLLAGFNVSASAIKITNTTISNSGGYGLYLGGLSYFNSFSSNNFEANTFISAFIPARQLYQIDGNSNFVGQNGLDGIMTGGTVEHDEDVIWPKANYYVTSKIILNSGVTITPGAYFNMQPPSSILVYSGGFLNATGTEDDQITFTSTSSSYHWGGILLNSISELNKLHYCIVSNGGNEVFTGMGYAANVASEWGTLSVMNSTIQNGLGYGIIVKNRSQINNDVTSVNYFSNFVHGNVLPDVLNDPNAPSLAGEWLDSFRAAKNNLVIGNIYNVTTGTWFDGAANPWEMTTGFGLRINADNSFTWNIVINTSVESCPSYNAEYITGTITDEYGYITFNQDYWRSRFDSSCDPSQNVDSEIDPYTHMLRYEILKTYDMWTGEVIWELKFYNPDNTSFSYYRKG